MSNRNFDNRVIIQRLQEKNYARNLYQNNVNGQALIRNPQNTDGNSSRYDTYVSGAQTDYYKGLLGGEVTVNIGGIANISPYTTPPTITSITPGETSLSVAFTAGSSGGFPITGYEYSINGGTSFTDAGTTVSPISIAGLTNGTSYQVIIRAVNVLGVGANSNEVSAIAGITPSPPTNLAFELIGLDYVIISFTAGAPGSDPITNYSYSLNDGSFTAFSPDQGVSPVTITGLNSSTSYTIRLKAITATGSSVQSSSITTTTFSAPALYYDPNNSTCYPGTGLTVSNIGTAGSVNGTIRSLVALTWPIGTDISGHVFDFNGGAIIEYGVYDFTNYITINVWVYPRNRFNINTILANASSGGGPKPGFKTSWNAYETTDYRMRFEAGSSSQQTDIQSNPNIVTANAWQFLTYVLDNTNHTINLYKNATLIIPPSPAAIVSGITVSGQSFSIGQMTDYEFGMDGQLGYVKVYNQILTNIQILNEFNQTKAQFGL